MSSPKTGADYLADQRVIDTARLRLLEDIHTIDRSIITLRATQYGDELTAARRATTVDNLIKCRQQLLARYKRIL